jgi:hypothetical protein
MREQPTAVELIEAVTEFLRAEAVPALSGRVAFHTRVAANVLDIVRRQLTLGPAGERTEAERLRALIGHDGDREALNAELCDLIAGGGIERTDPRFIEHLWATTLDTLSVDQPNHATYQRAAETGKISAR